jgi:hypothetical protein
MDIWVKIPTKWMLDKENPSLKKFRWKGQIKSDFTAALMLYIAIAHHANSEKNRYFSRPGCAKLSYREFTTVTGLSRAKISGGLKVLSEYDLIEIIKSEKTNILRLRHYEPVGWAKLPGKSMYTEHNESIRPFLQFKLRHKTELNALKLYLLLVALRDNKKNHANPSYNTISLYTGISRNDIRSAISLLINLNMVHVNKIIDPNGSDNYNNFYRIIGIDDYRHTGNFSPDTLLG